MALISQGSTPSWKSELPKIPKWNLDKVEAKAKEAYKGPLRVYKTIPLDREVRKSLVESLLEAMGLKEHKKAGLAALETLLPFDGQRITDGLARTLAYQIAANSQQIREGVPIKKFTGVAVPQWVPMEILGFTPAQRGTKTLANVHLLVLDGPFAGFEATRVMPIGFLFVFANDLGFSRKRPYEEPKDLIGFRFAAWVEPSSSEDLQFDKYWLTPGIERYNTALVKSRKPTDKEIEEEAE